MWEKGDSKHKPLEGGEKSKKKKSFRSTVLFKGKSNQGDTLPKNAKNFGS